MSESRRSFLKKTTAAFVAGGTTVTASAADREVAIITDPSDAVAREQPVRWALDEVQASLKRRGFRVELPDGKQRETPRAERIVAASCTSALARPDLEAAHLSLEGVPESLALVRGKDLLVSGSDARGLVYGLLDLADRIALAADPLAALRGVERVVQRPANPIRSITRNFASEPEDKPWFYDRAFWERYLTMLARERFNRFSLAFGLGYNAPRRVPDSYFYFPYPFLLAVPGYKVTARGLADEERDKNLAMLRWISEQTASRGLHFQLALWTQAYQFAESPDVNYPIDGLSADTHAGYCRDAIRALIEACPKVSGVTLRAHSESGIPEGSYDFWRTLLDGIARCGRRVEIDIHSKGIEHRLIDMAMATRQPVKVSPKYWAEHMGLPYHQAAIRELERSRPGSAVEQQRSFTRYGYADYLAEDRAYGVYYRVWPGTQRLLLWGDPAMAAGYSRYATFCGSEGLELCEPLSFKGRMGSGKPGGREVYADASLRAPDWERYAYSYRLWGRLLYDPDERPECWGRLLKADFGPASASCEAALAQASRILPLLTTAHLPSASNNRFWPEVYTDMPIVDAGRSHPYSDTPSPRRFGTVSPLDPALFSRVEEFADEILKRQLTGRYSPVDVANWLEKFSQNAQKNLSQAEKEVPRRDAPSFRRLAQDVRIQSGLGLFFAGKLRAAVAYALHEKTGDRAALEIALHHYRGACDAWRKLASGAGNVYVKDLAFGREAWLRGHWGDRLGAIEADLGDMEKRAQAGSAAGSGSNGSQSPYVAALLTARQRPSVRCTHVPAGSFRRGEPLAIELALERGHQPAGVLLHCRHVNQAEEYRVESMSLQGERCRAAIPGDYTASKYPLMYFFELREKDGGAWLYPGFAEDLSNQPYFTVRVERPA